MRPPDYVGKAARCWKTDLEKAHQHANDRPHGSIAGWLVHCPLPHLPWSYYAVVVVHLRRQEGLPDAVLQYPEAEYEFIIYGVNHEMCPEPDPDRGSWPHLVPHNVCVQFHGPLDEGAAEVCELAAKAIADGQALPDGMVGYSGKKSLEITGFREGWKAKILATAGHYTDGHGQTGH